MKKRDKLTHQHFKKKGPFIERRRRRRKNRMMMMICDYLFQTP